MSSILILLVVLAVGGAIARSVFGRTRGGSSSDHGATGLFVFVAMYAALLTFAIGASSVLAGLLERPAAGRAVSAGELSATVIGLPVFVALARSAWRRVREHPAERGGTGWSLYINAALVTTLTMALFAGYQLFSDWADNDSFGNDLGVVLVWAPLWALHWWAWRSAGDERRPDAYWVLASTAGISMLAGGGVWLMSTALRRLIHELADDLAAVRSSGELADPLILLGLGALTWWWHWLRTGARRREAGARVGYLLIVGVFGGVAAMYVGAVGTLTRVSIWFFGDPGTVSAGRYFDVVATFGPLALVGGAVWLYHRMVLGPRRDRERGELDRVYDYLMTALAALVTTGALVVLGVVVLSLLAPSTAVASEMETSNTVLVALALLAFGAPTWLLRWKDLRTRIDREDSEARSPTRRFYLLALVAIAGSVAFVAAIVTLAAILGAITGERTGSVLGNLRIPLAVLVGAGGLGFYHLRLYLTERHRFDKPTRREVTVVVPAGADLDALEALRDLSVTRIDRLPNGTSEVDLDAVVAAIEATDADRLLAIVRSDGIETIPLA